MRGQCCAQGASNEEGWGFGASRVEQHLDDQIRQLDDVRHLISSFLGATPPAGFARKCAVVGHQGPHFYLDTIAHERRSNR